MSPIRAFYSYKYNTISNVSDLQYTTLLLLDKAIVKVNVSILILKGYDYLSNTDFTFKIPIPTVLLSLKMVLRDGHGTKSIFCNMYFPLEHIELMCHCNYHELIV